METYFYLIILILNLIVYYFYYRLPTFLKAFDNPSTKLKNHKKPIPLSGGLSICITIIFILLTGDYALYKNLNLIFLIVIVYIIGFLDDLHFLSPIQRLGCLSSIIILLIFLEPFYLISEIKIYDHIISTNLLIGIFITVFSFLAVINAFNFIDGIDGLSSLMFSSILILCLFLELKLNFSIMILIASIIIYLYFNFTKKSFLGDSGIYVISSFLFFYLLQKYQLDHFKLTQIILMLSLPGVDLVTVTILRIYNKKKIYNGDRNHFHHFLYDSYGLIKTLIIIMIFFWTPNLIFNYLNASFEIVFILFIIFYLLTFNILIKKRGLIFE